MLFESFWKPISQQIDQVEYYFSPDLTPPEFIPWLASWLGLQVDPMLPVDRVRLLLKNAMLLYQCRGTKKALTTYLEIYTSGEVGIVEHQAVNFVIGQDTALGMGIALGKDNRPNLISISLQVPESELTRTQYSEDMYKRKMAEIVRTLVPAHTFFNVRCEFYALQN
jgi:phage tail-like protein